jgi:hypothetical protein
MQGAFLALIVPVGGSPAYPDNSLPIPPAYPGNALPGGGYPGHDLPWAPAYPGNALPGGGHIGNRPPWAPAYPGNALPPGGIVQPPVFPTLPIAPGGSEGGGVGGHPSNPISGGFILAWSPVYGWIYIPSGGGGSAGNPDMPDNSLPKPPPSGGTVTPPIQPTPAPKS